MFSADIDRHNKQKIRAKMTTVLPQIAIHIAKLSRLVANGCDTFAIIPAIRISQRRRARIVVIQDVTDSFTTDLICVAALQQST
jgi:hypothetical protein